MNRSSVVLVATALVLSLVPAANAQEGEEISKFQSLRTQFEELRADLESPQKAFDERYVEELNKLVETSQKSGNLSMVIAIEEEKKSFTTITEESTLSKFPELAKLQKIYDEEARRLFGERKAKLGNLGSAYHGQLAELRAGLTTAGEIDAALEAQREMERIAALLTSLGEDEPVLRMAELSPEVRERQVRELVTSQVWHRHIEGGDTHRFAFDEGGKVRSSDPGTTWKKWSVENGELVIFGELGKVVCTQSAQPPYTFSCKAHDGRAATFVGIEER